MTNIINKIFDSLLNKITKPIDQYFPGCLTELKLPKIKELYLSICNELEINLETLDLICCGLPAKNSGNNYDFLIEKRKKQIAEFKINKIYSNCPSCVYNLQKDGFNSEPILKIIYQQLLKREQQNQENTITHNIKENTLNNKLNNMKKEKLEELNKKTNNNRKNKENNKTKKTTKLGLTVTFHDPCHMGRYLGEYELPRKILKLIGCEIKEMKHNKESSMCCGAGGGLINNNPKLAIEIGKKRIEEAEEVADILVTCCPLCYLHLKSVNKTNKISQIYEISELIAKYLGLET